MIISNLEKVIDRIKILSKDKTDNLQCRKGERKESKNGIRQADSFGCIKIKKKNQEAINITTKILP